MEDMREENVFIFGLEPASFGKNSITLGFNAVNNLDNCIVLSVSEPDKPNTLEFRKNGDILVHGKLIENDKQIVEGLREFLIKIMTVK
jgi:hypothetical protein